MSRNYDNEIDNTLNVIDSRDIIEWHEYLEEEAATAEEEGGNLSTKDFNMLQVLRNLCRQGEQSEEWADGTPVIREDYFEEYIREVIDDCYDDLRKLNSADYSAWPYRHVKLDLQAAANEALSDYIELDFDGVTYYVRG